MNFLKQIWYRLLIFFTRIDYFYYLLKVERLKAENEKLREEIRRRRK